MVEEILEYAECPNRKGEIHKGRLITRVYEDNFLPHIEPGEPVFIPEGGLELKPNELAKKLAPPLEPERESIFGRTVLLSLTIAIILGYLLMSNLYYPIIDLWIATRDIAGLQILSRLWLFHIFFLVGLPSISLYIGIKISQRVFASQKKKFDEEYREVKSYYDKIMSNRSRGYYCDKKECQYLFYAEVNYPIKIDHYEKFVCISPEEMKKAVDKNFSDVMNQMQQYLMDFLTKSSND